MPSLNLWESNSGAPPLSVQFLDYNYTLPDTRSRGLILLEVIFSVINVLFLNAHPKIPKVQINGGKNKIYAIVNGNICAQPNFNN